VFRLVFWGADLETRRAAGNLNEARAAATKGDHLAALLGEVCDNRRLSLLPTPRRGADNWE